MNTDQLKAELQKVATDFAERVTVLTLRTVAGAVRDSEVEFIKQRRQMRLNFGSARKCKVEGCEMRAAGPRYDWCCRGHGAEFYAKSVRKAKRR